MFKTVLRISPLIVDNVRFSSSLTKLVVDGGVANLTFTSQKTRNCLSLEMMEKVIEDLNTAAKDESVRSVVVRGEGKVFSSGHNLKEMTVDTGYDYHMKIFDTCSKMMLLVENLPVPVISVVNGVAAAAGCQFIASSDIVIATPQSRFSTPGAAVGLFCHTPGIPLARRVPRAVSGYMLLTGDSITGEDAFRAGLVSRLVEEDLIDSEVSRICASIATKPKQVIALGKKFYKQQMEMSLKSAYDAGGQVMAENLWYKDTQEGIQAFKEKRHPVFTHTDDTIPR
eukprot:TRINITY_DN9461_c0_g1_i1.p1 TRINITY_DN9461_c0_g1~~TRINITY_DN9461_c0_g1_i1.p1  ORF type:complete len:283 (-),score=39.74 TRINITY_DN9461_c0_g1_i1:156-1004(-)